MHNTTRETALTLSCHDLICWSSSLLLVLMLATLAYAQAPMKIGDGGRTGMALPEKSVRLKLMSPSFLRTVSNLSKTC